MLKDYYYTDKEELDALRVENAKLRANITNLVTKLANLEEDDSKKELSQNEPVLTEGEEVLLDLFRRVPEDKQQLVLQMIRAALGSQ